MITMFIGNNAMGKTIALKSQMNKTEAPYSSNIEDGILLDKLRLSNKSCKIVAEELSAFKVVGDDTSILYAEYIDKSTSDIYSKELFGMLTILSKDVKTVFLDEPTTNLSNEESYVLAEVIKRLSAELGLNFYVATHDSWLLSAQDKQVFIAEGADRLVEVTDEDSLYEMLWSF